MLFLAWKPAAHCNLVGTSAKWSDSSLVISVLTPIGQTLQFSVPYITSTLLWTREKCKKMKVDSNW